jgi:hypothetical protein
MAAPLYAAIVGIDGCGKSACFANALEILAGSREAVGIGDRIYVFTKDLGVAESPPIRWESVKAWSRSAAKKVHHPLSYKVAKLIELACWARIQKALKAEGNAEIILGDGAPLINIAAWGVRYHPGIFDREHCARALEYLSGEKKIPPQEMLFYLTRLPEVFLFNLLEIAAFPVPDATFFLHVTPRLAMERIRARGEKLQPHETITFLESLQAAYELVCDLIQSGMGRAVHRISVDNLTANEAAAILAEKIGALIEEGHG